jgi:hypothetical protein
MRPFKILVLTAWFGPLLTRKSVKIGGENFVPVALASVKATSIGSSIITWRVSQCAVKVGCADKICVKKRNTMKKYLKKNVNFTDERL